MKHTTDSAILDIDGQRIKVCKLDFLESFVCVDNWIKVPDFHYNANQLLRHMVLSPDAHMQGFYYVLLPILERGVHGQLDPVLSSRGYLCRVERSECVAWGDLSQSERDEMVNRYPKIGIPDGSGIPEVIGVSHLELLIPVHDIISNRYKPFLQ